MTAISKILRRLRMRKPSPPPIPEARPVRFEWATPDWYDAAKEAERAEDLDAQELMRAIRENKGG